jgi:Ca2+-binding EF-hand superfamily protein
MRGLGYIDEFDLKTGLSELGIYASYDDLKLFFKAYDSNKDGKVRYSEFCDAIVP